MAYLADSIWVNVSTSGTADFTTTTALAGYRTFADASTPNGSTIHYSARSATQFENGEGIYSSGTGIVTRATIFASSSAGAKVNFSGSPTLVVAPLAEDFGASALTIGTTTITGGTTKHVLYDLAGEVEEAANFTIESGDPNVLSGNSYLYNNVSAVKAVTASQNWFFGNSGNLTASGVGNVGIGHTGVGSVTSGVGNVGIGYAAGTAIAGGSSNVAIGNSALATNASGNNNLAVGYHALLATTGGTNTGIGAGALESNVGGVANTAIGAGTLIANVSGNYNIAIGYQASAVSTGDENVAIGYLAGQALASGSSNTFIGVAASYSQTAGSSNIAIGNRVEVPSATGSSQLVIGNYIYGTGLSSTGTTISAGKIGFGIKAPACEVDIDGCVRAKGYTVATLPAAGIAGRRAYVTDASTATPAFMAALTGGGSANVPVFDDGTIWRYG